MALSIRAVSGSHYKASYNYFDMTGGTDVNWPSVLNVLLPMSSDFCASVYTKISEDTYVAGCSLEDKF